MNIDELEDLYIEEVKESCNFDGILELYNLCSEDPQIKNNLGEVQLVHAEFISLLAAFGCMLDKQILISSIAGNGDNISHMLIMSPEDMFDVMTTLSEFNQTYILNSIKGITTGERIQLKESLKNQDKDKWNEILYIHNIDDVAKSVGLLSQIHKIRDSNIVDSALLSKKFFRLFDYVNLPNFNSPQPLIRDYMEQNVAIEDCLKYTNKFGPDYDFDASFPELIRHLETLLRFYYFCNHNFSFEEKEIINTILSLPYICDIKERIFKECMDFQKKLKTINDDTDSLKEEPKPIFNHLSQKPKYKYAIIKKLAHRLAGTPNPDNDANFKVQKIFIHQDQVGLFCYFLTDEVTPGDFDMDKMDNEILWEGTWQSFKYLLYKLYGISLPPNCAIAVTEKFRFNASKTQKVKEKTFKGSNWARIVKDIKSKTDVTLDEKSEIDYLDEILKFLS